MTKKTKTNKTRLTPEGKEQALQAAYAFWEKNTHILVDDLCKQFKTNRKDLSAWLLNNSKARPDGRIIGKGSPRQLAIKDAYEAARAKNETSLWAARYAAAQGFTVGKGDIRYYSMKADLPDLQEGNGLRLQEPPNKKRL